MWTWVFPVGTEEDMWTWVFPVGTELRMYLRTFVLDQMVQAASSSAGFWIIKRVEQTLQELGVNLKPKVPTKAVCAEHLELRKEILTLLNLQKQDLSFMQEKIHIVLAQ